MRSLIGWRTFKLQRVIAFMDSGGGSQSPTKSTNPPVPAERWDLFGPPPLFDGENTESYDELLARISAAVKPADILEEIWVRDIVDLAWEALRLRKLKANLMTATAYKGLEQILEPLVES